MIGFFLRHPWLFFWRFYFVKLHLQSFGHTAQNQFISLGAAPLTQEPSGGLHDQSWRPLSILRNFQELVTVIKGLWKVKIINHGNLFWACPQLTTRPVGTFLFIWKHYAINQPFWDVLCSPAGPKRLAGNGVVNGVISARAWILWIIGKNPRTFHKKFLSKSLIEWGDVTFHYDFHQIREILIFCIGNPIVNLMDFDDYQ